MEEIKDGLEYFILSNHLSFSYKFLSNHRHIPTIYAVWFYRFVLNVPDMYVLPLFLFQAWRQRCGLQGATGWTRSGYTGLKDNQSGLVTEIKKSGN